ncbi:MAG: hypothetical protein ACYS14_04525 [Planctomycetota bacterium]|jgi:hypothetical protein
MLEDYRNSPMSVGEWMITLLVLAIPLVNLIMYLYWALSTSGNVNRKNFCIASILWFFIVMGIAMVFSLLVGGLALIAG